MNENLKNIIIMHKKIIIGLIVFVVGWLCWLGYSFVSRNYTIAAKHNVFVRVGDMNIARSNHEAVLLKDGSVLLLSSLEPSEIYNPQKRNFKLIDSMNKAHGAFTSTLLKDGRVLIVGGPKETSIISAKAELFNPKTNKFRFSAKLNYPRGSHTATLLKDGRVLVVGGEMFIHQNGIPDLHRLVPCSEIYNPKTDNFEVGPKMNIPRSEHSAILLNDGNVLILGGSSGNNKALDNPELYIVKENKFIMLKETPCSIITFDNPLPIILENGNVLIPNCAIFKTRKNIHIFNPNSLTFKDTMISLKPNFIGNKSILLKNGNVLFFGGSKDTHWYYKGIKNSFIYNPHLNKLINGPNLKFARSSSTATLLNDGTILITGGKGDSADKILKSAELYLP